jgi:hypothetical protein
MRRILIADAPYDPAWTRTRSAIYPQDGIGASSTVPTVQGTTGPLLSSVQASSPSIWGAFTRKTWATPISQPALTAAAITPPINQTYIVAAQAQRRMLTIQNNSSATPSDTAPTLWIGFGVPAVPGQSLALAPGAAVAYELNPPQEELFYTWGAYSNSGASTIIQGVIEQSISLSSPAASGAPASPSMTAQ